MNFLSRFLILLLVVAIAWIALYIAFWLFLIFIIAAPFVYLFVRWRIRSIRKNLNH